MMRHEAVIDGVIREVIARLTEPASAIEIANAQREVAVKRAEMLENQCSDLRTALFTTVYLLRDLRAHGTRFDPHPTEATIYGTRLSGPGGKSWYDYLRRIDDAIRSRAGETLEHESVRRFV